MYSPLEQKPKVLELIGLFIVLFNGIDSRLGTEFYWILDQTDRKKRPILDFLETQQTSSKIEILKEILGPDLYKELGELNKFRNQLCHGMYGVNLATGEISNTKRLKKPAKKSKTPYFKIESINEKILEKYIERERSVLQEFYKLALSRLPK
ncbi:MAG: hypothetical protein JWM20_152 [Patescibacteria group bacterium]|nr:hypothetical protein [Patescibacteria group bacterium]